MRHHVNLGTLNASTGKAVHVTRKRSTKAVPICVRICNQLYSLGYLGWFGAHCRHRTDAWDRFWLPDGVSPPPVNISRGAVAVYVRTRTLAKKKLKFQRTKKTHANHVTLDLLASPTQ